jgi:uncharacterized protein YggE
MKLWGKIFLTGFIFSLFLANVSFAAECNARCCDEEYPKLIVQGEGKIEVLADKAYFNVRVRQEEKKLDRSFSESAKKINSISETLASFGIKKEDIRNLGYIYHPLYEGKAIFSTISRPTSYEVIYSLRVTVYDLDKLGKILTSLSEVPETSVFGLVYTSTKIEELKREVLKEAASDARQKAVKLAEGSGASLGKVMKIETRIQEHLLRNVLAEQQIDYSAAKLEQRTAPQMESGYIEVIGNCTVVYSIQ